MAAAAASSPNGTRVEEQLDTAGLRRLNYIGSKLQLIPWIFATIKEKTNFADFKNKRFIDVFAGTGIVSYAVRMQEGIVIGNDAEVYSSIITHALARSTYTDKCRLLIGRLNADITAGRQVTPGAEPGYITRSYSPVGVDNRTFFTEDNARRADFLRGAIEQARTAEALTDDEYSFMVASLLVSTDRIANVAAVYGCFLKQFKASARQPLVLTPIHLQTEPANPDSRVLNLDATTPEFLLQAEGDIAYIDPPYNNRQYSKNYFPLAMLAKDPSTLENEPALKGKTGIPEGCFISQLCQKRHAADSMRKLLTGIRAEWVFVSYNTEAIIPEAEMVEMMKALGEVSVVKRDYKRFKSYNYNEDKAIQELLFCLHKH